MMGANLDDKVKWLKDCSFSAWGNVDKCHFGRFKMKQNLSLNFKLSALVALLGLLIGIIVFSTIISASRQAKDTFVINVAGRQRMLTQRLTKSVLGYTTAIREDKEAEKIADIVVKTRSHLAASIGKAKKAGDFKLTESMLNFTPASAARQITAAFSDGKHLTLRQTSRKYRNPVNKPDAYENQVLAAMESDAQAWRNRVWKEKVIEGDRATMRFMRPLFVSEPCLVCHASADAVPDLIKQEFPGDLAIGYREGDIRGAISISWPTRVADIEEFRKESTQARTLFDTTLTALMSGGKVTLGAKEVVLDACQNGGIKQQLDLVKRAWDKIADATDIVMDDNADSTAFNAALDFVLANNVDLLVKMNKAVTLFQKEADSRAKLNRDVLFASVFVSLLVLGFVLYFVRVKISKPILRIVANLTENSGQVGSAADEVSSASQSLAEGATVQAASLEETSSSLEEMSSMTRQNADNARQANALASQARSAADNGAKSVTRMNSAILDIQKSADETAKIIKVIDEIAFQTNLLALNAAVEAARAGEAGKGFAVVAEEVRNLAMRSAEAAKSTATMIQDSVKNSNSGVEIAGEVGKVLDEIVSGIGKTTDLVGEISAASREQAQGIEQVNSAVTQMDKVTQQNAATAEESASASEELSSQTESMNELIQKLATMVDGEGHQTNSRAKHFNVRKAPEVIGKHSAPDASDDMFHRIAHSAPKRREPNPAAPPISAKRAIPLDSDTNTSDDFKEFND